MKVRVQFVVESDLGCINKDVELARACVVRSVVPLADTLHNAVDQLVKELGGSAEVTKFIEEANEFERVKAARDKLDEELRARCGERIKTGKANRSR